MRIVPLHHQLQYTNLFTLRIPRSSSASPAPSPNPGPTPSAPAPVREFNSERFEAEDPFIANLIQDITSPDTLTTFTTSAEPTEPPLHRRRLSAAPCPTPRPVPTPTPTSTLHQRDSSNQPSPLPPSCGNTTSLPPSVTAAGSGPTTTRTSHGPTRRTGRTSSSSTSHLLPDTNFTTPSSLESPTSTSRDTNLFYCAMLHLTKSVEANNRSLFCLTDALKSNREQATDLLTNMRHNITSISTQMSTGVELFKDYMTAQQKGNPCRNLTPHYQPSMTMSRRLSL